MGYIHTLCVDVGGETIIFRPQYSQKSNNYERNRTSVRSSVSFLQYFLQALYKYFCALREDLIFFPSYIEMRYKFGVERSETQIRVARCVYFIVSIFSFFCLLF